MIKDLNDIDRNSKEGRLLFAALAKITTESQRDKTPDEVIEQLEGLARAMEDTEPTRKVKTSKRYTFEIIHYEGGRSVMNRKNEGFSVMEMLGVLELIKEQLFKVFQGAVKPDEINLSSSNSPIIHKEA